MGGICCIVLLSNSESGVIQRGLLENPIYIYMIYMGLSRENLYLYLIISKVPPCFFGDYLTKVSRGRSPMGILMDTTLLECASQLVIG